MQFQNIILLLIFIIIVIIAYIWLVNLSSINQNKHLLSNEDKVVRSNYPGRVIKLNKNVGDTIYNGDIVLILDSMKMEIEVKASKEGIVKSISVIEGQDIKENEIILEIY